MVVGIKSGENGQEDEVEKRLELIMALIEEQGAEGLLEAQTHLWNLTFSFINSMSLKCAIELGIPDIIHQHGRPITLTELVASLHVSSAKSNWVYRLLRLLVHSGFLAKTKPNSSSTTEEREDLYHLTPTSTLVVKGKFDNLSPFVLMMLDSALVNPWHFLCPSFQQDEVNSSPFKMAHDRSFWNCPGELNRPFNEAMASDTKFIMSIIASKWREVFEGLKTLVDVGGGNGAAAIAVAKWFPDIKCSVLELPHVVATAPKSTGTVEFIGGDMFQSIPQADAVFLKWILHDWSDEDCVKILKRCKEAIPSKEEGGKVIILDMVVNEDKEEHKFLETQLFFDMLMMVLAKGKERTKPEWQKIFLDAGFARYKIKPVLGVRSIIEVYP